MREIKFRAKATTGEWVHGSLVNYSETQLAIFVLKNGGHDVFIVRNRETVGQFTGFLDSKGEEIYEGDILSDSYEDPKEGLIVSRETVFFDVTLGTWMLDQSSNQDGSYASSLAANLEDYDYTVIGNIHEKSPLNDSK